MSEKEGYHCGVEEDNWEFGKECKENDSKIKLFLVDFYLLRQNSRNPKYGLLQFERTCYNISPCPFLSGPPVTKVLALHIGDSIRFWQGDSLSRQGKVVDVRPENRPFNIKMDKDTVLRRNRYHLLKTIVPTMIEEDNKHSISEPNDNKADVGRDSNKQEETFIKRLRSGREIKTPIRFQ